MSSTSDANTDLPESARWLPRGTFAGQICLVTGGGTGLGLEISRGLAALGATVVIASRHRENHNALVEEASQRGWVANKWEDMRAAKANTRRATASAR